MALICRPRAPGQARRPAAGPGRPVVLCLLALLLAAAAQGALGAPKQKKGYWVKVKRVRRPTPKKQATAPPPPIVNGKTHPADVAALLALNAEVQKASPDGAGIPGWFPGAESDPCGDPDNEVLPFPGVLCPRQVPGQPAPLRVVSLVLYEMRLTATSVAPVTGLSELTALVMLGNSFSGPIPAGLASLPALANIDLRNNNFSGPIPDLTGAPLASLLLSNQTGVGGTGLTGPIPAFLGTMTGLSLLDLAMNSLQGPIPESLVRLPKLNALILSRNQLSGKIPSLAALAPTLQLLDLSRNPFEPGPIPSELNNLTVVNGVLDLSYMNLQGRLVSLRNLGSVVDLILDGNSLSGPLYPRILPVGSLGFFSIKNNNFSGPIKSNLLGVLNNNLYCMTTCGINFANNSFSGSLPASLGDILQAFVFDFSNNRLTGTIPNKYGYVYSMLQLKLQNNRLTGPTPDFNPPPVVTYQLMLAELDLSGNLLSGPFPEHITRFTRLKKMDLSSNRLYGSVPSISALFQLTYLNISKNLFSGMPPPVMSASALDVSSNFFGGSYSTFAAQYSASQQVLPGANCFRCAAGSGDCGMPKQRSTKSCSGFCQASTQGPLCSGRGTCGVWRGSTKPRCKCVNQTRLYVSACPSAG